MARDKEGLLQSMVSVLKAAFGTDAHCALEREVARSQASSSIDRLEAEARALTAVVKENPGSLSDVLEQVIRNM